MQITDALRLGILIPFISSTCGTFFSSLWLCIDWERWAKNWISFLPTFMVFLSKALFGWPKTAGGSGVIRFLKRWLLVAFSWDLS